MYQLEQCLFIGLYADLQRKHCNFSWKGEQNPWQGGKADASFCSGLVAGAGLQLLTTQCFVLGCRWEQMTDVVFCEVCIGLLDGKE